MSCSQLNIRKSCLFLRVRYQITKRLCVCNLVLLILSHLQYLCLFKTPLFNLVPRRRHLSVSMLNKHYLLNITLVLPGLNPKAAEKYPHEYLGVPTTLIIIQTRFWRLEVFDKNSNAHFPLVINHNPLHSQGSQLYTSDPQRIDE